MASAVVLNLGVALAVAVLGFGGLLAVVSAVSWWRLRRAKLLVVGGAFVVLAIKGGLAAWTGYTERRIDTAAVALDFGVLAFLYASVAMR